MIKFVLALVFFVSGFTAQVANALTVSPSEIQKLPGIKVLGVKVDKGPSFAAVQPGAFLRLTFASCSRLVLEPKVEEKSGVLFVSVELPAGQVDCMGPAKDRVYEFQISSDFRHSVVVLNPVPVSYK